MYYKEKENKKSGW